MTVCALITAVVIGCCAEVVGLRLPKRNWTLVSLILQKLPGFAKDLQTKTFIYLSTHKHKAPPAGHKQTSKGCMYKRPTRATENWSKRPKICPRVLVGRESSLHHGVEGCTPASADHSEGDMRHRVRSINVFLKDEGERKRGDAAATGWIMVVRRAGGAKSSWTSESVCSSWSTGENAASTKDCHPRLFCHNTLARANAQSGPLKLQKKNVAGTDRSTSTYVQGKTYLVKRRLARACVCVRACETKASTQRPRCGRHHIEGAPRRVCSCWFNVKNSPQPFLTAAQSHLQRTRSRREHQLHLHSFVWIKFNKNEELLFSLAAIKCGSSIFS